MAIDIKKLIEPHLDFTKSMYITFPKGWGDYYVQLHRYEYDVNRRSHIRKLYEKIAHADRLIEQLNDVSGGEIFFLFDKLWLNSAHLYGIYRYRRNMDILSRAGETILRAAREQKAA